MTAITAGDPQDRVDEAFTAVRGGRPVLVVGRRYGTALGGVLVAAAADISLNTLDFLLSHGRGPLYAMLDKARLIQLHLTPTPNGGAYFLPVNSADCTMNGLSATDRLRTLHTLAAAASTPLDFLSQGQVTPIGAREGGVLERAGQTEAAVDLVRLAGLPQAAAGSVVLAPDGNLATRPQLSELSREHAIPLLSIQDIIHYRRTHENILERTEEVTIPFRAGRFRVIGFRDRYEPGEHLAVIAGEPGSLESVPIYVHAECINGDVFGSQSCSCATRLTAAMDELSRLRTGVLVYMRAAPGDTAHFVHRPFPAGTEALTLDDRRPDEVDQARHGVLQSILTNLGITDDHTHFIDASPEGNVAWHGSAWTSVRRNSPAQ